MMTHAFSLLESTASWIWTASWQATLIAGLVMLSQWGLRRRLSARWRNALWLLVFARLLMPALPASRCSAYNWLPKSRDIPAANLRDARGIQGSAPVEADLFAVSHQNAPQPPQGVPKGTQRPDQNWRLGTLLSFTWGIGFVVTLGMGAAGYVRLRRRAIRFRRNVPESLQDQFQAAKTELQVKHAEVMVSEAVPAPMVTGLWRARVILPPGLESTLSPEDVRMVLLHELAHVRRGDLWIAWLAWVAGALHWFNPAVHYASSRARKDREMACDEWVLQTTADSDAYGSALVSFLESRQSAQPRLGTIGIFESKAALIQRVKRIAGYRRPTVWGSLVGVCVLMVVGVLTLTGASERKPATNASSVSPQDSLMEAVENKNISMAKKALGKGADPNAQTDTDLGPATPMDSAVRQGNLDMVRLLVTHGGNPRGKTKTCSVSYAEVAVLYGHPGLLRYLHSLVPDSCDPLVYAAATGDVDVVRKRLEAASKETILKAASAAAINNQAAVLAVFVEQPVDREKLFRDAAEGGAIDAMQFLLSQGVDLKKTGARALGLAARRQEAGAVAWLLNQGVGANGTPPGIIPLQSAAREGSIKTAKLLLDAGADPNTRDERDETPLFAAFFRDRVDMVRLLLDRGARLDVVDKQGFPPLYIAASLHAAGAIRLLLERGADVKFKHSIYPTPLAMAQQFIGEDGAVLKMRNSYRQAAAIAKGVETVKALLDYGTDINTPGLDGMPPLSTAAAHGQSAVFDLLLERGADINCGDTKGGTPLFHALLPYFGDEPHLGMIDKLLAWGADPNGGAKNPDGKPGSLSALKAAMIGGNCGGSRDAEPPPPAVARKLIATLLKHRARFPVRKDSPEENMLLAATMGDTETVRKLLTLRIPPDSADADGWTPLMSASALGYGEIMRTLIDAGARVNAHDAHNLNPLWLAISSNPSLEDIHLLLDKGADSNIYVDSFGTALTVAIYRNNVELVAELLRRSADPNIPRDIRKDFRQAPIHTATVDKRTDPEIARLLLQYGADPNPKCFENRTPLYWAVYYKRIETVRELLAAGADPGKVDDYRETIAQMADRSDNPEIKELIQGALAKNKGATPKRESLP